MTISRSVQQHLTACSPFEKYARVYIGWPTRTDAWREGAKHARNAVARFASSIIYNTNEIEVVLVSSSLADKKKAEDALLPLIEPPYSSRISVIAIPSNDCWLQDIGPVYVRSPQGQVRGVCFQFNAWGGSMGGCYTEYGLDSLFSCALLRRTPYPCQKADIILEGGSLSSDGRGTFLTTRECLLNSNRNPDLDQSAIEEVLTVHLGARKVIWLDEGAAYDSDTDGHVDNIATFIALATVLLLWADAEVCAEQHRRSSNALEILNSSTDVNGTPLQVHLVNAPRPMHRTQEEALDISQGAKARMAGDRLCASYVNVLIMENTVFAPSFGDATADELARIQLETAFAASMRKVLMIPARELVLAGGGLHCISLAEPISTDVDHSSATSIADRRTTSDVCRESRVGSRNIA